MSEQLDYEATKAALRAQAVRRSLAHHGLSTYAWKWFAAAASMIVVVCAIVTTVWVTSDSPTASVQLIPSGDHRGASSALRETARSAADAIPIPGAPTLLGSTAVIQPDGSITGLDAAGNVVTIAAPTPAQTEAVLRIWRLPGATSAAAAAILPVAAPIVPPRGKGADPVNPPTGGGPSVPPPPAPTTPQPTNPPPPPPSTTTQTPPPPSSTPEPTPTTPDPTTPPPTTQEPTQTAPTQDNPPAGPTGGGTDSGDGNPS